MLGEDNFMRRFTVEGIQYMAAVRPSQFKKSHGTPQYFIQIWKMDSSKSGSLYQPALKEWPLPSIQGYAVRTMNIEVEYSLFIQHFKEYEKLKSGKSIPKTYRY